MTSGLESSSLILAWTCFSALEGVVQMPKHKQKTRRVKFSVQTHLDDALWDLQMTLT